MRKPKNIKDFFLGILIILVILLILKGISLLSESNPEAADLQVMSGTEKITALRTISSETKKNSTEKGDSFEIEEDADAFPVLYLDGSIILDAGEDPYGGMYYTIYKEDFSELYYRSERFAYPEEPGTYYIVIDTKWGSSSHYLTTQYGFTLIIE